MRKLVPVTGVMAILLLSSVLLLAASRTSSPPSFSRSRWIAEQRARGAWFSGGVVPADPARLKSLLEVVTTPGRARGPQNFRVSFDILEPDGGRAEPETQTEPMIALNPEREGHLLAGYQEGRFVEGGCRAVTYSVSFNGGRTWQEGLLPGITKAAGGPFDRTSDPWVAFGPDNRAYYAALGFNETNAANGIFVSFSADGGLSWNGPITVHSGTANSFDDKEAIVVDTRSDSPFRGRVYVAWDAATTGQGQPLLLARSVDGGLTYTTTTVQPTGANVGVLPLVGPGGVVHLVWIRFQASGSFVTGVLLAARSTDGGETWSAPVTIAEDFASGVPGSRTADGIPAAAVDPRNGNLYVVWQDSRFTAGADQVLLSRSLDGGETWSAPKVVSDGPGDAASFTPAVAVTAEGRVGVVYYSLRLDPARRVLADEYLAVSRDGGRRFGRSARVSTLSSDLRFAAFSDGFFLGDYQGIAGGKRVFHPLWIATLNRSRSDPTAHQPDAFTRPIAVP